MFGPDDAGAPAASVPALSCALDPSGAAELLAAEPVAGRLAWPALATAVRFPVEPPGSAGWPVGLAAGWLAGGDERWLLVRPALLAGGLLCARTESGEKVGEPPPNVQACTAPSTGWLSPAPFGLRIQPVSVGPAVQYDQDALLGGV